MGWQVTTSEFAYLAKDPVSLSADVKKEVEAFLNELDDNDDVQKIYAAMK